MSCLNPLSYSLWLRVTSTILTQVLGNTAANNQRRDDGVIIVDETQVIQWKWKAGQDFKIKQEMLDITIAYLSTGMSKSL